MSMSWVGFFGTVLALLAFAAWWVRREWKQSAGRRQRARKSAERQKADDLRDCRVAHQSLVPDRSERDADASGDASVPGRRRAEERWKHAYSTASRLDPELPAKRGEGS
jgi:ABC-type nickel/cobalt efflux system permease component RcnA